MARRYPQPYPITLGYFIPDGGLHFSVRNRTEELLAIAFEELLRSGCQFNMCDGPRIQPIHMLTCSACATIAQLAKHFGVYTQLTTPWREEAKRGKCVQH